MSYASRLRVTLDLKQPTGNVGYVGRKVQTPGLGKSFGRVSFTPSEEMMEKVYQQSILGGYTKKRNTICNVCFEMRSCTGICSCSE